MEIVCDPVPFDAIVSGAYSFGMRIDLAKAARVSEVGTFVVSLVVATVAFWPLLSSTNVPSVRPMIGWVPPIILGICLVLAAVLRLKAAQASRAISSTQPTQQPETARVRGSDTARVTSVRADPADNRIFIHKTPFELVAPFDNLTTYQAKKLVEDVYNSWVRWVVTIGNVAQYGDTPHISSYVRQNTEDLLIALTFSFDVSEKAKIVHLSKDTVVTIEGQITEVSMQQVKLENCRLTEVGSSS